MTDTKQPEALRLAEALRSRYPLSTDIAVPAAAELERQHAAIQTLRAALTATRGELWRVLDAKGHDGKTISEWPEIVAASAALKATEEA